MRMSENNACITVNWDILNFSFLWDNVEMNLPFHAVLFKNTDWMLTLHPNAGRNNISCNLQRVDGSADTFEVDFELAFLDENGAVLKMKKGEEIFSQQSSFEIGSLLKDDVLVVRKNEFLPQDVLKARLKMWRRDMKSLSNVKIYAMSYTDVEIKSFVWNIDNFSNVQTNQEIKYKGNLFFRSGELTFRLRISKNDREKLIVCINYRIVRKIFILLKFHIIDSKGNYLNCGMEKISFSIAKKHYSLPLSREILRENKDSFLTNDTLSLKCEYAIYKEALTTIITNVEYENVSSKLVNPKLVNPSSRTLPTFNSREGQNDCGDSMVKDFSALYQERILCDMRVQTETETIPAHTVVLSARSPVFRCMLTGDFKEKAQGCVNISDLDTDTVRRMLIYMYTDFIEDLHWESAMKLYIAADKYEILSLKRKCSSFLKDNLKVKNVCDALCFADLHHDKDLKRAAQVYILQHANIVMKLTEWRQLMETNSTLAAETMYKNWEKD